jgi:osmotically-inducible protein OsmY
VHITRWAAAAALCAGLGACGPETAIGVAATAGTAAMEERGLSAAIGDAAIKTELNARFLGRSGDLWTGVSVQVVEGRVLLSGKVREPEMRVEAVRTAWQVDGVREVINEINVTSRSLTGTMAGDTWISTKLKARLMFDKDVSAINYSIVTVGGVIYLMGIAQNQAELDRVINHARDIADVRGVESHVRLKNDPRRNET